MGTVAVGTEVVILRKKDGSRLVLEVCVESLERAMAAELGGADRVELCSNLHAGGVTPGVRLMQTVRKKLGIPIHALIRPRAGDFLYSPSEFAAMKRDILVAKGLGMDGIVLGVLDAKQRVNVRRTKDLVKTAHPLPVTFHRAFDLCERQVAAALEAVIETGAKRLLTSGGNAKASGGLSVLSSLVKSAGERIVVMPGGGIRASNVENILRRSGAQEVHSSLGAQRGSGNGAPVGEFEARVRRVRRLLDALR